MRLPVQLDRLVAAAQSDNNVQAGFVDPGTGHAVWLIAKPLTYCSLSQIGQRIYHAWLVLTGRAKAFQYAEDALACGAPCIHPYARLTETLTLDPEFRLSEPLQQHLADGFRYTDRGETWEYNQPLKAWFKVTTGYSIQS